MGSMEIDNDGVALHVQVDGDPEAPAVLLLHGITSSVRTWEWLVPELVDRYRLIRLDFRGHGRSGRTPGAYQPAGYVSDAAAACRQVAAGACIVVGHSLGGMTAISMAQQHPELVRALVLEDPPLGVPDGRALEGNTLLDGFRLMRRSVPRLQAEGIGEDVLAAILGRAPSAVATPFGEMLHADALDAMAAGMLELDASVLDPVLEGTTIPVFDPDVRVGPPTLLLTADPTSPDAVARPHDIERVLRTSPHVQVRVMPGASHLIHDELAHRDDFVEALTSFLATV